MTPGRIYPVGSGLTQRYHGSVRVKGLRGAPQTEVTCAPSTLPGPVTPKMKTSCRQITPVHPRDKTLCSCKCLSANDRSVCRSRLSLWLTSCVLTVVPYTDVYTFDMSLLSFCGFFLLVLSLFIIILFFIFLSESGAFCWWGRCNGITQYNNESSSLIRNWGILVTLFY